MNRKKGILLSLGMGIPLLLGGCGLLNQEKSQEEIEKELYEEYEKNLISVQEYTGQGYELDNGEENDKIAEAHREEVIQTTEKFFKEKYKTEIKVHNLVGNIDGVTVFVESVGEPHFYTYAIVPIDSNEEIVSDGVFSQEDQVEGAIRSGVYAMVYDKEIQKLDNYLKEFTSKHPVVGLRNEAVENVGGEGYSSPYYFISIIDTAFDHNINELYLKNPEMTKEEWKKALEGVNIKPKDILITVELFMKEQNKEPDSSIFDQLVSDIENMDGLPPGAYSILLNDNRIGKDSATGSKENTLERGYPKEIIKQ